MRSKALFSRWLEHEVSWASIATLELCWHKWLGMWLIYVLREHCQSHARKLGMVPLPRGITTELMSMASEHKETLMSQRGVTTIHPGDWWSLPSGLRACGSYQLETYWASASAPTPTGCQAVLPFRAWKLHAQEKMDLVLVHILGTEGNMRVNIPCKLSKITWENRSSDVAVDPDFAVSLPPTLI